MPPLLLLLALAAPSAPPAGAATAAMALPTEGFRPERLSYRLQKPYNIPIEERYSARDGTYHFWVFSDDKPLRPGNRTKPRTEMRFPDYTHGAEEYEADLLVPRGTAGVCVMQIHTADDLSPRYGATTFMVFVEASDGGSLHFYSGPELARNIYGRWFHLNVIHDLGTDTVSMYLDNRLVFTKRDQRAGDYYMKTGVYAQRGETKLMQVYIRNLRLWRR